MNVFCNLLLLLVTKAQDQTTSFIKLICHCDRAVFSTMYYLRRKTYFGVAYMKSNSIGSSLLNREQNDLLVHVIYVYQG